MALRTSTIHALEWDRFLELISQFARTDPGREHFLQWNESQFATSVEQANLQQALTFEALTALPRHSLWDALSDLPDYRPTWERLGRAAVLSIEELWLALRWIRAARVWQEFPKQEIQKESQTQRLAQALAHVAQATSLGKLQQELSRIVTDTGDFSENASPRLIQLHQELRSLRSQLQTQLDAVLRDYDRRGVLQDQFADFRDGRYVVPVRMGSQGEVEGNFLETSASRQTIYVEPAEMAQGNQALSRKRLEIEEERHRILVAMSKILHAALGELQSVTEILVYWDVLHAKARVGTRVGGMPIEVVDRQEWKLTECAHPLLFWTMESGDITRNTIHLQADTRVLLFSGPNTGGKTVFLKTLGMAALCARSGIPFPGADHARVPFFDQIECDLGDPQSIEAHLSTFSGHLVQLREILSEARPGTLVLLDELNSSTDPEEGYALSHALLDALIERGAWVGATTHDPRLKALALEDKKITNASVQFDESSQKPTYRVLIGAPGRSRALETAERLGIPAPILKAARGYLSSSHRAFETQLAGLEKDAAQAARSRQEAQTLRTEAARLEREWRTRMDSSLQETLARTRSKMRKLFENAQEELRQLLVQAHNAKNASELESVRGAIQKTLSATLDASTETVRAESPELPQMEENRAPVPSAEQLVAGAQVRLPKWKSLGKVLDVQGDRVRVAMGGLQIQVKRQEIEFVAAPRKSKTHSNPVEVSEAHGAEIDLRGKRFEEAMMELRAYLDVAYRSGLYSQVRIIHGFGTGALREGTRALLAKLPYVKTAADSAPQQGGAGATQVEFDR